MVERAEHSDKGVFMKIRVSVRAVAVAIAAGLVLTGCAAPEPSAPTGPQTLNLSVQAPPSDFSVGNWTGGDPTLLLSIYDTIVGVDGKGAIVPAIAESWEYSDDSLTLTFTIREGQKFSNGEIVDAAAVAASLQQSRQGASSSANLASIADVTAPDDTTVVVTLAEPDAALLTLLGGAAGVVGAPSVLTAESSTLEPVGSGAYTLDKAATTVGSVYSLTRNDDNWNADAYPFETVKMTVIADDTAALNALKAGQLDYGRISEAQIAQFPESEYTTGESLPAAVGGLWLVDRAGDIVPALADVRVRQAINMALDRDSIASNLTEGAFPTTQIYSPTGEAYSKDLEETYPFDVEAAKGLMAEAGYADGFEITMPSTVISQVYDATISQELSEIGITVNYETVPFQDFYSKVFGGNYAMYFMFNGFSGNDAQDTNSVMGGVFNPFGTTTPELDELLDAANAAPLDEQGEAFAAVNEYLVDEAWFAPISYATGVWVATNRITFTPPVSQHDVLPFGLAD
jgi:peptide/nickel transport system substrate-binding protein